VIASLAMSQRFRLLNLLICAALACAGLPAHACAEAGEAAGDVHIEETVAEPAAPCPHHAPTVVDAAPQYHPESADDGDEAACCGLDCTCRCGATAPALTIPASPSERSIDAATLSLATALAPSLTPERLLRPPIPSA